MIVPSEYKVLFAENFEEVSQASQASSTTSLEESAEPEGGPNAGRCIPQLRMQVLDLSLS